MSFPRLYVAASLKRPCQSASRRDARRFSAALCRGLIEAPWRARWSRWTARFSAALCRGLIEASRRIASHGNRARFPRLYVAASLKRVASGRAGVARMGVFSAALCRDLIEARGCRRPPAPASPGFPRLYVAASLKQWQCPPRRVRVAPVFRGFMSRPEARHRYGSVEYRPRGFPRLYVAASLKLRRAGRSVDGPGAVFRGFMSRPH